ncbi:hypothetical protein EII10_12735 [Actinomyces bowdenii]|uniref:Uncharacterized protein n=1 Tax=Actinomyces bowdenii TaxID=131109 RepID=A0A3P1UN95_9ACTO|nr:hypothetical protein EII10_12735 [Actinomyces bowdenii]
MQHPLRLNAPYGAGCLLTRSTERSFSSPCLNAPYGAGCLLTTHPGAFGAQCPGLNAPYGAGCLLTPQRARLG